VTNALSHKVVIDPSSSISLNISVRFDFSYSLGQQTASITGVDWNANCKTVLNYSLTKGSVTIKKGISYGNANKVERFSDTPNAEFVEKLIGESLRNAVKKLSI